MKLSEFSELERLQQDLADALSADLETGSHHFNNAAHKAFAEKHPRLIAAMNALDTFVDQVNVEK